jgi:hypothetical protein
MRLRQGYSFIHLGHLFGIQRGTASKIFIEILLELHRLVYVNMIQKKVPTLAQCQDFVPPEFEMFKHVKFLLDATEFRCETPKLFNHQCSVYSMYYDDSTFKFLIACTPRGKICFVSQAFGGSTSDQQATEKSNFLKLLNPGEAVMVDKGFLIHEMAEKVGVGVVMPPFLRKIQFTEPEVEQTNSIARARVHVERVIRDIKAFKILANRIPVYEFDRITILVQVCAGLVNFQSPSIKVTDKWIKR